MIGYVVEMRGHLESEHRGEGEFAEWSRSYHNTCKRIRLSRPDENPDVLSSLQFNPGDNLYVVWCEYSSGDSFGKSEREYTEVVGVFKAAAAAEELATALTKFKPDPDISDWVDKYKFVLDTSDGQHIEIERVPWAGYFEHLDKVHVEELTLSGLTRWSYD